MKPFRSVIYVLTVVSILFLSWSVSLAQMESLKGVELNDGRCIYGKILKMNDAEVIIQETDGKISTYKFDNVQTFLKDGPAESATAVQKTAEPATEPGGKGEVKLQASAEAGAEKSAGTKPEIKATPSTPVARHIWSIGPELSYIRYKEQGVEERGMMYGIVGSYAYHNRIMLKAEAKYSYGLLDYEGSTWSGIPLNINTVTDNMWELRALMGYDIPVLKATTLTPYIGIGYRFLEDNAQQKYAGGYKRESNYIYSPIGLEAATDLGNGWFCGATVEFDVFWWGRQVSHLNDVDPGFNLVENDQNSGYGVRGSIKLMKRWGMMDFILEPFIKYWDIGESKSSDITYYGAYWTSGVEPKNNSTEIGCNITLRF